MLTFYFYMNFKKIIVGTLLVGFFISGLVPLHADENQVYEFEASISEQNLAKDLSFAPFENRIQVGLPGGSLKTAAIIKISAMYESIAQLPGLQSVGPMYQIDIPSSAFASGRYFVSIKSSGSNKYKQIYFFDSNFPGNWRPLPTNENFGKGVISSFVTIPFARLAVFESSSIIVTGKASWYRYKNGLFAASPDFPQGTRLRVINTENKKSVDVIVNDFGPNRALHPDRVVDLDAVAFTRLASLGQGTISVAVEKLPDNVVIPQEPVLPVQDDDDLNISAKSAVVFNSADKVIMWSKDAERQIPLASLTKLIAVKVFLETKPDLKKVVAYSVKDEQLNNLYVPASQSARLSLKDGDTVTIKDLVYSSLIGSTNNTVESLVRISGLKRTDFIARMNQRVKQWGATKTHFIEPTGLSEKNVTTAKDYVIIAREAFLDPIISSASVLPSYTVTTKNTKTSRSFKNTNLLARDKNIELLGSKTGYLVEAGNCLATKWSSDVSKNIIIVVLGAPTRPISVDDTKKLLEFARKNIK